MNFFKPNSLSSIFLIIVSSYLFLSACNTNSDAQNDTPRQNQSQSKPDSVAVDVAIARKINLDNPREYIGSTQPLQQVSLRSQVEGRLLELNTDLGDSVKEGEILGRLDDSLLASKVQETEAELASRESEVAKAKTEVENARNLWEKAKIELEQAKNDAERAKNLFAEGAISRQSAELAETKAKVAQQEVLTAEKQIKIREQEVAIAKGKIATQKAIINQEKQRQIYTKLVSPINGIVLEKINEPGNLINPGGEVLKIGDFSQVKVIVPVSDLELGKIKIGQTTRVKLDAFPQENFTGVVTKISPQSDPNTRQIPVEIIIDNPQGKIGNLMLARVTFQSLNEAQIIIPQTAIQEQRDTTGVFVVKNSPEFEEYIVEKREVILGRERQDKVEIIRGLEVGERFVINSEEPLENNQKVRLSIISE
jgi:RND family efflux transporter MFP subunit